MTKLYYGAKRFFGDAKLIIAGVALGAGLFMSGCEKEVVAPDGTTVTVTVDDPTHGTVTITPTTQEPDTTTVEPTTQDPDTTTVEPTTQDPDTTTVEQTEEVKVPNYILYDENGDYYQPQKVTLVNFYDKVEEVKDKYEFENDWERDVYVSNLMAYNAGYMDAKDIDTVYHDYLENIGIPVIMQQKDYLGTDIAAGENKVAMSDYFIDPVLADEAAIFEKYVDSKGAYMASEKFNGLLRELKNEKGIETYDEKMYNSLLDLEYYVFGTNKGKNVSDFFSYSKCEGYQHYYDNSCSNVVYYQNIKKYENNFENYTVANYVSSHQEEKTK